MRRAFFVFFGVFFTIYGLLNYYIGKRGWQVFNNLIPGLNSKVYWGIFWFVALSFLAGRLLRSWLPYSVSNILTVMGSYWLGIMFYTFLITLLIDVIRGLDRLFGFIPQSIKNHPSVLSILGAIVLVILGGILIYGSWSARSTKVVHYDITVPKKAGNMNSLHIVAMSDIHLGAIVDDDRIKKAVPIVNGLNPDLVLLVGDTVDEDINIFEEKNLAVIFSQIKSKLGNYAIMGNHEYIGGHTDEAISYIEKSGFKVLRDSSVKINDSFYLVGRDDNSRARTNGTARKSLKDVMQGVDTRLPVILMDHQPLNLSEPANMGVDLEFSGHTHRGQLFPNQFITRKIYENDWGLLKKGNFHSIVSSGFGTWGPPIRLGSRSEILDITVKFE